MLTAMAGTESSQSAVTPDARVTVASRDSHEFAISYTTMCIGDRTRDLGKLVD